MYIQYRGLKPIRMSGRPDEDNEAILRGDYLDKSQEDFVMPNQDEMMKYIFSNWQTGDILVIANSPLKHPKIQGNTLVEMTREEICQSGDLSILIDGEYFENGKIIKIEYNEELGYIKPMWHRESHTWIESATDIELVDAQYAEYEPMDKPSVLEEMGDELATEVKDMLIQLRGMKYELVQAQQTKARRIKRDVGHIELPQPSEELKNFKNKFNLTK